MQCQASSSPINSRFKSAQGGEADELNWSREELDSRGRERVVRAISQVFSPENYPENCRQWQELANFLEKTGLNS